MECLTEKDRNIGRKKDRKIERKKLQPIEGAGKKKRSRKGATGKGTFLSQTFFWVQLRYLNPCDVL